MSTGKKIFYIYDKGLKKEVFRTFSTKKYTDDEINKLSKEWVEAVEKKNKEYDENKFKLAAEKAKDFQNKINIAYENEKVINDINLYLDKNTGNTTAIFGSSKKGKTTLLMYLYNKYYKDFITVLFSENKHINSYNDKKLLKAIRFEPNIIEMMKLINSKTKNKYDFCVLIDDIIDKKFNTILHKLILTYRNSNISTIISLQNVTLLLKSARDNINNMIFFGFNQDEEIERIIRKYLGSYLKGTVEDKIKWYKEKTKDYQFIYLNTKENKLSFHKLNI